MKKIIYALFLLIGLNKAANAQFLCSANFTYTVSGNTVTFVNTSTSTSGAFNYANSYFDFGNNTQVHFSYPTNQTVTYNSMGPVTVCIRIMDSVNTGCTDSMCQTITIGGTPASCSTTFSYSNNNSTFYFTPNSWNGTAPYTYNWLIKDTIANTILYSGNAVNPSVTIPQGNYAVVYLTSTDSTGCVSTNYQIVGLNWMPNSLACNAAFVLFQDTSNVHTYFGYNYSSGTGLTYNWNWGDGSFSTGAYPTHTYASAGFYVVCLTVMGNGCMDSLCMNYFINKMDQSKAMRSITILDNTNGITHVQTAAVKVYPNPASNQITVDLNGKKIESIKIIATNGQVIATSNFSTISISNLAPAIYFIEANTAQGTFRSKFIKE